MPSNALKRLVQSSNNLADQIKEVRMAEWHTAFPTPISSPSSITREEMYDLIKAQSDLSQRKFLVVDVRRTDFDVSISRGLGVVRRLRRREEADREDRSGSSREL